MDNLNLIEEHYKKFTSNILKYVPEGMLDVDLKMLEHFGLIHFQKVASAESGLTRYFHVIESQEKITLINEQFVIWIIPEKYEETSATYTLIALNQPESPKLEMAICHAGVYNTSRLVLRVLEKILFEIQENEELLLKFSKSA